MRIHHGAWSGQVMTVAGLIPAEAMGITLPHEHLAVQGWDCRSRNYLNSACMELVKFTDQGGNTIVDVSSTGLARDPLFLKELAARAGIQVIMGTGFYKEAWLPPNVRDMSVDEMAQVMVGDITHGVEETGVHAGVIGELGVSRSITHTEEKVLAAAAHAQRVTGGAISLHFDLGSAQSVYQRALDILEGEGVDLRRVAVGHLVARPDSLGICQYLARRSCYVEFDLFGQERRLLMADLVNTHPEVQISSIRGLIDNGLLQHLLLSQNVNHVELMTVNGGGGYGYLLGQVVPKLKAYSVTDAEIRTMLVENPKRLLSF